MVVNLTTCGDAAAEEAHLLQRGLGVDHDGAGRVKHGVLGEGGGVEEVVHRLPHPRAAVHHGEPGAAIGSHGALEWVHAVSPAQVCVVGLAVRAGSALPVEDGDHMVAGGQVLHPFPHALHHSGLSVIGGKASCIRSPSIGLRIRC